MTDTIWVAVLSFAGTLVGSGGGLLIANRLVMWRLEQLEKRVEKHNQVVERTVALERDVKTAYSRIDEQRELCKSLHQR